MSMLLKRKDLRDRPLYIDGIPDVDPEKIPHEALPEGCTGENWDEWLPTNAILVIDECQRYWRQRPNGSKVPKAIQEMETHRHRGVDLFLIGIQTAAIIMAALSGNNDFKTAKQFTAYLGLDPAEYKSGTSVKGKDRISKVGDCITRAALFSPALVAYRIGTFPRLVANMRQNGKHIMQILTAIMRKLAVCMPMPGIVIRLSAFCLSSGFLLMYVFRRPSASFILLPR